ncbi:ankyrin-1 [Trichonephila clavipes]|nr:ankyrin-1 [Trichonephila clavipes]
MQEFRQIKSHCRIAVNSQADSDVNLRLKGPLHRSLTSLNFLSNIIFRQICHREREECKLLINLSIKVGKNPLQPGDEDDECHNAYYYAIRSNNSELLEALIYKWPNDYFSENEHQLDELLSLTYKELKLKNIDLSYEIQFCVETVLINLRFNYENTQSENPVTQKDLNNRIELIIEKVNSLKDMYIDTDEDDQFLLIAKFIAKNLFILKRQLKCTYCKLPWEEMEFCLIAFVRSRMYNHELNFICNCVLDKIKILSYLERFSSCLMTEMNNIKKLDLKKLYVFPRVKRTKIVADIIKDIPLFEELYRDYHIIRDMHSLEKIESYADLLITVNCTSDEGRIIMTRTVQVIGEHLKNTLESPKLSDSTCELILTYLPNDTRQIFNGLRDSLSHADSFTKRRELETNVDTNFYRNIQNDVKKVKAVVLEIMLKNKIKVIKLLLKKLMNCTTLYDFKNVLNPLKTINLETYIQSVMLSKTSETVIEEMHQLENLIEKFSHTVIKKTPHEEYLFNEIKNIVKYEKSKLKDSKNDYSTGLMYFAATLKQIKLFKIDENCLRVVKYRAKKTMDYLNSGIESKNLKTITELVVLLRGSATSRKGIDIDKINELTYEIIVLVEYQIDDVKWLSVLKNKLSNDKFQKGHKNVTANQKKFTFEDQQIPKLEIILGNLRNILRKNNLDVYSKDSLISYKNNKNLQVIVEMLMLDVMCILSDSKNSAPNLLSLDKDCPLLIGKNLRNHLAQENALFDILQFDCSLAIIINAMKITSENIIDYKPTGADVKAKDFNLKTTLHFAAEGGNLDIIKLLKDNLTINGKDRDGQSPLHIASALGYKNVVRFFVVELQATVDGDNLCRTPLHLAAKNGHIRVFLDRSNVDTCVLWGGFTSLHLAAENGCLELVNLLLKRGADVNAKTDQLNTALHLSSFNGYTDILKTLIMNGADINVHNVNGGTALHNAAENGHEDIVEILLEHGAKVNAVEGCNFSPLNFAAYYGYFNIVKTLINFKADINNITNNEATPLLMAAKSGHLEIVQFLCYKKASLHFKDIIGYTALHLSCANGHTDIVKYLVQKGAKIEGVNVYNQIPLHLAAEKGHIEIVEILILEGNDLNFKDDFGSTALHYSSKNEHLDVVKILIRNGAVINIWNNMHVSPLFLTIENGNFEIIEFLIAEGADINLTNYLGHKALHFSILYRKKEVLEYLIQKGENVNDPCDGLTPLQFAVQNNDFEMAQVLINNGAEIDADSDSGLTPLCLAVRNNNKEIVKILLKYGADINAKKSLPLSSAILFGLNNIAAILLENEETDIHYRGIDGNSLLHIASKQGNCFIVETLLARGADANAITLQNGISPLHCAADAGYVEIVKILLKSKAKINAVSNDGLTPLHLAALKGHTSVVKLLLENEANAKITDNENRNSVEIAVANGNVEVAKFLLQEKIFHINDKGNCGFSLLHIAAQEGNLNVVKYLIDHGADVNSENDAGSKPIHIAAREGHKDIVELFLNCKSLNNYLGAFDQSLVHYATLGSKTEVLKLLIELKFDVNATDRNDVKPIHIAVNTGDKNILLILLQRGAYYDALYDGLTPLQLALNCNHVCCVQLLILIKELFNAVKHNNFSEVENCIKKGVVFNVKNSENVSPLHYACWKGYEGIVNLLLENKADPNVIGKGGSTPLHYAAKFNHFSIVKILLLNGGVYNAKCNNHRNPLDFTSNNDIKKLLQLIEECFRKVKKGDIEIIATMQKIANIQIIRCIMNACDQKNQTLIIAGIYSDFPKMKHLRNFCQDGMSFYIKKADDLCSKEKYTEALPLLEKVLERRKQLFGEENPVTLDIQTRLGDVLYKLQFYQKALQTFEFVFLKQKELLGANHSDVLKTRESIGLVLHRLGKNEEAISIFREILPKLQEILGSNHSAVLETQSDMALALNSIGQHEEALALNYKVLKVHKKFLPPNHPFILVAKNNIAVVLLSQKKKTE